VTLDTVEAFLAQAGDEGLTWEAKGTERPHSGSVRKHISAFANTVGGFYIVGASQDGDNGSWRLDPVDFGDEPQTWLSRVIRSNLRPVPFFDVKAWPRDSGQIAVVNVDSVAEPPSMTVDGEVFTRVSGESYPVTDPVALQRLLERGAARAAEAEALALRAAAVPDAEGHYSNLSPRLRLRLSLAPTGRLDDIGGRLFTQGFFDALTEAAGRLPAAPLFPYPAANAFARTTTQDSIILRETTAENRQRWTLHARWDGSVAAYFDLLPKPDDNPSLMDVAIFANAVRPAAHLLLDLVRTLGGYGRVHFVLVVDADKFEVMSVNGNRGDIPSPGTMLPIRAWIDDDPSSLDDALDRMRRELCRAAGAVVWEPEPEGAQEREVASAG